MHDGVGPLTVKKAADLEKGVPGEDPPEPEPKVLVSWAGSGDREWRREAGGQRVPVDGGLTCCVLGWGAGGGWEGGVCGGLEGEG